MTTIHTASALLQSLHATAQVRSFPRERFAPRDLHAAVGRGDRLARAVVWNRHASDVREFLHGHLGRDVAGDLVHDVFAAFFYSALELDDARSTHDDLMAKAQRVATFAERYRRTKIPWPSTASLDDEKPEHIATQEAALDRIEAVMEQVATRPTLAFLVRYDAVTSISSRGRVVPIRRSYVWPWLVALTLFLGATLTLLVPARGASTPEWQQLVRAEAPSAWSELLKRGEFGAVVGQAMKRGLSSCTRESSSSDLRVLADAAVYLGRFDIADEALTALRERGPREASVGAFLLGRMNELQNRTQDALDWYDKYLGGTPTLGFAGEALAGRMRTLLATGHRAAAKAAARDYLERYPDGLQAVAAERVWDSP